MSDSLLSGNSHGPRREDGFSMIELLVVMVLISLVMSFTIPSIRTNLYSDQLKATTRKLVGLVTEASQEAVRSRSEYLLYFDLEHNKVGIGSGGGGSSQSDSPAARSLAIPDSVQIVDVATAHGEKRAQDKVTLRFSQRGYIDKTAIHLRSDDGREMTIILSPFMGTVRIYDSYRELEDDRIHL